MIPAHKTQHANSGGERKGDELYLVGDVIPNRESLPEHKRSERTQVNDTPTSE